MKSATPYHAERGTAVHSVIEQCLLEDRDPREFLGEWIQVEDEECLEFPISFCMEEKEISAVELFMETINDYTGMPHQIYSEQFMQHSEFPELQGTSDCLILQGVNGLVVMDYKNGTVSVPARKRDGSLNPQLMCYLELACDWSGCDPDTASLVVVQPNRKTKKKVVTTNVTRTEREAFYGEIQRTAEYLRDCVQGRTEGELKDRLVEGSYCWYCPARKICPVQLAASLARDFNDE